MASGRPFYGSFAWAYDALSDRPVADECAFVATELTWLLECYDELCIGYPLVAMEARQFLRRAVIATSG